MAWRQAMAIRPEAGLQVARLELELGRRAAAERALRVALEHGGERARQAASRHPGLNELMSSMGGVG